MKENKELINKEEIKRIIMSMRNIKNEPIVNGLLGKVDMMSEEEIQREISKIGNTEEEINSYITIA